MLKTYTLGRDAAGGAERVEVLAGRGARPRLRLFGVEPEQGLLERLGAVLRRLGLLCSAEIDIIGPGGLVLASGSLDLAVAVAIAGLQDEAHVMDGRLAETFLLAALGPQGELLSVEGAGELLVQLGPEEHVILSREDGANAQRAGVSAQVLVAETLEEVLEHLAGWRQPLRAPERNTVRAREDRDHGSTAETTTSAGRAPKTWL